MRQHKWELWYLVTAMGQYRAISLCQCPCHAVRCA
jgi:hypothetical protein